GLAVDVVLDQHAVLKHADLRTVRCLTHHHDAFDRLAAGQELGLAHDRGAAGTRRAAVAAALLLRGQAHRAAHAEHVVTGAHRVRLAQPGGTALPRLAGLARLTDAHHRVRRVVIFRAAGGQVLGGLPAAAPATAPARALGVGDQPRLVGVVGLGGLGLGLLG